jgi:peptidoglycan/LPS O-acetylase OafA/YrhL
VNPPEAEAATAEAPAQRYVALDGLRGVAIAMVLWHHLVELNLPPGRASWLGWLRVSTALSWTGVDLFFTLSGFLIGGILIDHRGSGRLVRTFYLRRALRILPLYYFTLLVVALACTAGLPGSFHLFPEWVYALFLTNIAIAHAGVWDWLPLSVMWSLAVEEQFYLIAPWLMRLVAPHRIPLFAAVLVALAEIGRAIIYFQYPSRQLPMHVLTPLRMDALAFGIWAAWLVRSPSSSLVAGFLSRHLDGCAAAIIAVFAGLTLARSTEGSGSMALFGYTLVSLCYGVVVLVVVKAKPRPLLRMLESELLVSLGRRSYFIYLWHALLGASIIRWLGGADFELRSVTGAAIVALAIATTWLASAASWKWFEGPIVEVGRRSAY